MDVTCKSPECPRVVIARGYCDRHYRQWRRHGDSVPMNPHLDDLERILRRIEVSDSGCWLWTGAKDTNGYGQAHFEGRPWRLHQLFYELWWGARGSLHVLHDCDVKGCVCPDHLHLGTHADNMAEVGARGGWPMRKGVPNPRRRG